jgi:fatty acid-binding protein DegV
MDFAKTIINAIKIWVNNKISIIEDKIFVLENKSPTFIQTEEPPEVPEGSLWVDLDEESSDIIEIEIDSELSETSENPVQNKVINTAINNLNTLIGDTAVAE